jgi:hypothetical protein
VALWCRAAAECWYSCPALGHSLSLLLTGGMRNKEESDQWGCGSSQKGWCSGCNSPPETFVQPSSSETQITTPNSDPNS